MAMTIKPQLLTDDDALYPASDGVPVGETGIHALTLFWLYDALQTRFAAAPNVYVANDMFVYYQQGNPRACKAPDLMVIKGVSNQPRRIFRTWVEGTVPTVIFEIVSADTVEEDLQEKRELYSRLGVAEYFVFDPEATFLRPPLQGFRLKRKKYAAIKHAADGSLISEELALRMVPEGTLLRLIDAKTDQRLLTPAEERARLEQERQRVEELATEVARLRAELGSRKRGKKRPS
jgi:Uma2 family endonuclease